MQTFTKDLFKVHRSLWKFAGIIRPRKYQTLYSLWIVIFNFFIIFLYPTHLIIALFQPSETSTAELFHNLSTTIVNIQVSTKHILIWWNFQNILRLEDMFSTLDRSIQTKEERTYFKKITIRSKYIVNIVGSLYIVTIVMVGASIFIGDGFPGWLPINWRESFTNYIIMNMYQFFGVSIQICINIANDTYPAVSLVAISGHIRLLSMRVSKLGLDSATSQKDNNRELKKCIMDHKLLIDIHSHLSQVLSIEMFVMILCTGLNICFVVMYLAFFADNVFSKLYYAFLLVALPLEIFPSCYFGSVFETELDGLQYALFSCNWVDQDRKFKKNLLIFSERNLRKLSFECLGFFKVHLDSFFNAMRSAYSLLAVIIQTK